MTAKEKAIELRDKMMLYSFEKTKLNENTTHIDFRYKISADYAKQCAIIAVDEIIKDLKQSLEISKELHPHANGLIAGSLVFWKAVKTDLNKL